MWGRIQQRQQLNYRQHAEKPRFPGVFFLAPLICYVSQAESEALSRKLNLSFRKPKKTAAQGGKTTRHLRKTPGHEI